MHGGPATSPRGRQFITVMFIYINMYKYIIDICIYIYMHIVRWLQNGARTVRFDVGNYADLSSYVYIVPIISYVVELR